MAIVIGTSPYGKCDVVPELFYVATWFVHVDYVPLFPTGSRLVLGKTGNTYHVIKIPVSFKSILLAWTRTALCITMIGTGIWAIISISDAAKGPDSGIALPLLWALGSGSLFAFFMIYPRRKMPSYLRACHLATIANLNERGWAALNVLYGRDPMDRPDQAPI